MKKIQIILLIEVQILLVFLILLYLKVDQKDQNLKILTLKVIELEEAMLAQELSTPNGQDVVIGSPSAPNTVVMYTRFDCKVCDEFFHTVYPKLKTALIDQGKLRLVVRNLVHRSKPENLSLTHQLDYLYQRSQSGEAEWPISYVDSMLLDHRVPSHLGDLAGALAGDTATLHRLLVNASSYRRAGINMTPTFFVNGIKMVGNRDYEKFRSMMK